MTALPGCAKCALNARHGALHRFCATARTPLWQAPLRGAAKGGLPPIKGALHWMNILIGPSLFSAPIQRALAAPLKPRRSLTRSARRGAHPAPPLPQTPDHERHRMLSKLSPREQGLFANIICLTDDIAHLADYLNETRPQFVTTNLASNPSKDAAALAAKDRDYFRRLGQVADLVDRLKRLNGCSLDGCDLVDWANLSMFALCGRLDTDINRALAAMTVGFATLVTEMACHRLTDSGGRPLADYRGVGCFTCSPAILHPSEWYFGSVHLARYPRLLR